VKIAIGHTLLTWDVFAHPEQIERGIRDITELGFAGTETGGTLYDWWERHRPGELKRILRAARIPLVTLFQSGTWTDPAAAGALLEDANRWSAVIADLGGEMLMLVPGTRRELCWPFTPSEGRSWHFCRSSAKEPCRIE